MNKPTSADSERRRAQERLRQVKDKLEQLALIPPDLRDDAHWQRLAEEEARLMELLAGEGPA